MKTACEHETTSHCRVCKPTILLSSLPAYFTCDHRNERQSGNLTLLSSPSYVRPVVIWPSSPTHSSIFSLPEGTYGTLAVPPSLEMTGSRTHFCPFSNPTNACPQVKGKIGNIEIRHWTAHRTAFSYLHLFNTRYAANTDIGKSELPVAELVCQIWLWFMLSSPQSKGTI